VNGPGAFTPGAGPGGEDPIEMAVKHLRGCGFDERADAVQDLAAAHALAAETIRRALAVAAGLATALDYAQPYRAMWALQFEASSVYRRALEAVLGAPTLADAKLAAREALR
jgi:hypothetical protein